MPVNIAFFALFSFTCRHSVIQREAIDCISALGMSIAKLQPYMQRAITLMASSPVC